MNQKRKWIVSTSLTAALIMMASCASTPVAEEPIFEEPIEEQVIETKEKVEEELPIVDLDESSVREAKKLAEDARDEAVTANAHKASPDEFNAANLLFESGESSLESGDFDESIASYKSAILKFNEATESANNKRQLALDAIAKAEAALNQTQINADNAIAEQQEEEDAE